MTARQSVGFSVVACAAGLLRFYVEEMRVIQRRVLGLVGRG